MKYKSCAAWPKGTFDDLPTPNETSDTHDTLEQALAVCQALVKNGAGGDGKAFPIRAWMERVFEIGDKVQWTSVRPNGRSISMSTREGEIIGLSKPTGQKARVKLKNGKTEVLLTKGLRSVGETSELTEFVTGNKTTLENPS